MDDREKALLERMRTLCAGREYCEADIRKKLSQAFSRDGNDADAAGQSGMTDRIITSLKEDGFIDELRYASAFARDKSSISGWGKVKIRHCLAAKGIARQNIDCALAGVEGNPGLAKLSKALEAKAKVLAGDPQRKIKLLRFALGRGFEYEEVGNLVDKVLSGHID